jgi:phosphotransferase system enzyme I (PtsI)
VEKLNGIPVSDGIVMGKAMVFHTERLSVPRYVIPDRKVPFEIARFERALADTTEEILKIREEISQRLDEEHAHILDAHLLVLEDVLLIEETMNGIEKKKLNAEYIFMEVLEKLAENFSTMDDEYLKERASDIRDIGRRVLRNLMGKKISNSLRDVQEDVVIISHDLSPSDTAQMSREKIKGFATDIGGQTSHTAIMAKALQIPAVVGLKHITSVVRNGDIVIIDGHHGLVIVGPDRKAIHEYEDEKQQLEKFATELHEVKELPAVTLDGRKIELAANIELPEEIPTVMATGGQGIGLYRTEFFYLNRKDLPTEEEHFQAYKNVVEQIHPFPLVIRTLDLGGDKFLSPLEYPHEINPFLGCRAIRFCLERPDIFKAQLKGILRASAFGNIKIMFPMVTTLEELIHAKKIVEEAKVELEKKGMAYNKNVDIGTMIETPSAAMISDILAKEVDFFSIGTNDLIQYSLAVDRVNEKVASLYQPAHPGVLKLIKNIVDAGHRANIWVGMCGEMAGAPLYTIVLIGFGIDELSMSPVAIPEVKKVIRSISLTEAKKVTEQALTLSTGKEVERLLTEKLKKIMPDALVWNAEFQDTK